MPPAAGHVQWVALPGFRLRLHYRLAVTHFVCPSSACRQAFRKPLHGLFGAFKFAGNVLRGFSQ